MEITASDFEYPCLAGCVAEEMKARKWTCVDVANRMSGDYGLNVGAMNFFLVIDPENLVIDDCFISRLSEAFEVSKDFFINVHQSWVDNPNSREIFDCHEGLLGGFLSPGNDNLS